MVDQSHVLARDSVAGALGVDSSQRAGERAVISDARIKGEEIKKIIRARAAPGVDQSFLATIRDNEIAQTCASCTCSSIKLMLDNFFNTINSST